MKTILITGSNSFIGTSFEKWLEKPPNKYKVDTVDMKSNIWKEKDFSIYDVVFHVAGIAHVKETKKNKDCYYKINRDLAYETAKKSKESGVKQFVFLSSMSVYGKKSGVINKDTLLKPNCNYAKSKLQAEELIETLIDSNFKVVILRPPMIYGRGCKGNYPRLARLALKTPIFPEINNMRSMIYIDNLTEFVKQLIDNCSCGLFYPQNGTYVNTSELIEMIAEVHGKKIKFIKGLGWLIKLMCMNFCILNKVFGNLIYDKSLSNYKENYIVRDLRDSIVQTEK